MKPHIDPHFLLLEVPLVQVKLGLHFDGAEVGPSYTTGAGRDRIRWFRRYTVIRYNTYIIYIYIYYIHVVCNIIMLFVTHVYIYICYMIMFCMCILLRMYIGVMYVNR